jgi:amino acid adenylation domain-containing protein
LNIGNQISSFANTAELLTHLVALDVQLSVADGRLACTAPKGVLTPHLQRELTSRKPEILEILRQGGAPVIQGRRHDFHGLCIHECFEEQAARTPEAIAVVFGSERLTYCELSVRSNRLANRLRALGVGAEVLVGICLERSADMVIALLAVLKAGGAYVPLDPQLPRERLALMQEDSGVAIVITRRDLFDAMPWDRKSVLCVENSWELIGRESEECPARLAGPESLAYVMYTSGSTGKPKGVAVEHRAIVNFLGSMRTAPGISDRDRLLAVTTLSFDIAGLEIYLPLIAGAQLTIAPQAAVVDGAELARLLRESNATIMQATPVTWRLLVDSGWNGLPRLKMLCGGEALSRELANRLLLAGGELWNLYGPTETTIWSTIHRVDLRTGLVPIGRPIANTHTYVCDQNRQLVPAGIAGELYIGGDGLAREYFRRPEITAERFVADPFRPGYRMYRTGDLVRCLADGNLEYLGRQDRQVKLRGFRIELAEIEAALEQQPGVRQALVELREDTPGDQRLTAYLMSAARSDVQMLRQALATRLPAYMVPSAFVFLDAFPLTPNGKVDRKALPLPGAPTPIDLASPVSGRESTQNQLTAIWRTLLSVSEIGLHDDFFALGGHSLLTVQLQSRIRQQFSRELSITQLFQQPTIAALAELLDADPKIISRTTDVPGASTSASAAAAPPGRAVERTPSEGSLPRGSGYDSARNGYPYDGEAQRLSCLVPAQPGGTQLPLFLVAGFQGQDDTLLVLSRIIPHLGPDQPVYGLRPRWVQGGELYSSVEEEAREYLDELRVVQPDGPYLLGGYCLSGLVAFEMARQLLREGERVALLALIDTERPTATRTFVANVWARWERARHRFAVIWDLLRLNDRSKSRAARNLIRTKTKRLIRPSTTEISPEEAFYRSRMGYQRLIRDYVPTPYPGRITLIVNEDLYRSDRYRGWRGIPVGELFVKRAPGDHITMFTQHAQELARLLLGSIDGKVPERDRRPDRLEVGVL